MKIVRPFDKRDLFFIMPIELMTCCEEEISNNYIYAIIQSHKEVMHDMRK